MFLWIPVTLVTTADGCNDSGDENDGAEVNICPRPRSFQAAMTVGCPRSFWRLTAPRAVILELARESRGTKASTLGIYTSTGADWRMVFFPRVCEIAQIQ